MFEGASVSRRAKDAEAITTTRDLAKTYTKQSRANPEKGYIDIANIVCSIAQQVD